MYNYTSKRERTILSDFFATDVRAEKLINRYFAYAGPAQHNLCAGDATEANILHNLYFGDMYFAKDIVEGLPGYTNYIIETICNCIQQGYIAPLQKNSLQKFTNRLQALHARLLARCAKNDPALYAYHHAA